MIHVFYEEHDFLLTYLILITIHKTPLSLNIIGPTATFESGPNVSLTVKNLFI